MDHSEESQCSAKALSKETTARLLHFYQQGKLTDCTFQFADEQLKAHKLILACSSPVFEQMFYGSMTSNVIYIDDILVDIFQQVLDYIYTGDIIFYSIQHAWDLFYSAQKYILEDLLLLCRKYIVKNITLSTLLLCYEYADLYDQTSIKDKCGLAMRDNIYAIFYNGYHMKASTLKDLMKMPFTAIIKADIVYKIIEWAMYECQSTICEDVVQTLKTTEVLMFIDKQKIVQNECDYCLRKIMDCICVNETIQNVLKYLANENVVWDQYSSSQRFHKLRHAPLTVHNREEFKIACRIDLAADREFISIVSVDTECVVTGLNLSTEMKPINATKDSYCGTITIKIYDEFSKQQLATPTIISSEFDYDSYDYVPLRFPVVLEPNEFYEIRISYRNCDTVKSSLVCRYRSQHVENMSSARMFFYDMLGTVIKGIAFYPI